MARIFITGSSTGLGLLAGTMLAEQGHDVVLHARNAEKADAIRSALPQCRKVLISDVATVDEMRKIADQVNKLGRFDAVIHNVGIGNSEPSRIVTSDGLAHLFAVNVAAPYVLTALIERPKRLVYLSSSMHKGGSADLDDAQWERRQWDPSQAYCDSKLHDLILAMAVARRWPDVLTNAVDPGWVPTRMGGPGAPDDLAQGAFTQAWLAASDEPAACVSGQYFYHQSAMPMSPDAERPEVQDRLLDYLHAVTGVPLA
jgi:NAD(P)-dependent dehydrogenase (short-subunit alcohol dehydrogenase family)